MTISTIRINDINIRILEHKNEGKETVVFLHYGGATLGVWNGVIPYFIDNYHIVAQDLRCHGFTDKPINKCHIDDMAKDLVGIFDKLGVKKASIIGSSMGADVAISFAANYPQRVNCLVLDGGLYDLVGPDSKDQVFNETEIEKAKIDLKQRILSRPKEYFNSREEYLAINKERWEKYFPWSDTIKKATEDEIIEIDGKFTSPQTPEETWAYIEPLYNIRFIDYFKKITCPILWLPDEKEKDNDVVIRNLKKYAQKSKYYKIVTLYGSVHAYTCLLRPKEFSEVILQFFEEIKRER
ncbi:MAG: alpha/beta hydrolase [Candidatus Heimdallarchaeota archaeon]|nr:alpha/beta hydrolase [Candidatus Heimdallarchaeota archaeon]